MAEDDADGFVVAVALDAARGEAMTQAVELDDWNVKLPEQTGVVVSVSSWFCGLAVVSEYVELVVHHLHQRRKQPVKLWRKGYLAA